MPAGAQRTPYWRSAVVAALLEGFLLYILCDIMQVNVSAMALGACGMAVSLFASSILSGSICRRGSCGRPDSSVIGTDWVRFQRNSTVKRAFWAFRVHEKNTDGTKKNGINASARQSRLTRRPRRDRRGQERFQ